MPKILTTVRSSIADPLNFVDLLMMWLLFATRTLPKYEFSLYPDNRGKFVHASASRGRPGAGDQGRPGRAPIPFLLDRRSDGVPGKPGRGPRA
jgi:hypothetical protein